MMSKLTIGIRPLARKLPETTLAVTKKIPALSDKQLTRILPSIINQEKSKEVHSTEQTIPDSHYFQKLKFEEHRQFYHKRRARFYYAENYSAALSLPYSKLDLQRKQSDPEALLMLAKNNIIEHANRRVDLFFYTLIAYYKTQFFPTSGHTNLQHGRGRTIEGDTNLTQACHSSFTPSLIDNSIYENDGSRIKHKSLLSGTHLMNSLNSTVELPPFVNALDDILELRCRQKSLEIISKVSLGTIDPVEGTTLFLNMMKDVLEDLKQQAENESRSNLGRHSLIKQKTFNPKLIDLVITGTLGTTFSSNTGSVSADYINMLLRLSSEEQSYCKSGNENKDKIYLEKMKELQNEILDTKGTLNYP